MAACTACSCRSRAVDSVPPWVEELGYEAGELFPIFIGKFGLILTVDYRARTILFEKTEE